MNVKAKSQLISNKLPIHKTLSLIFEIEVICCRIFLSLNFQGKRKFLSLSALFRMLISLYRLNNDIQFQKKLKGSKRK